MFRPRIIPVLLLKNKGLVKTINFKSPTYIGDPINAVKIFNDMRSDELVFLDITASVENRLPLPEIISNISDEAYMPFAVGGGIKSINDVKAMIGAGAEKVVINSAAVTNPELISQVAELFGRQSIIVSIDVKKNLFGKQKVYTHSGTKQTALNPIEHAIEMEKRGAGEILINSIDKEGCMTGYDIDLIKKITSVVKIPVIAVGGAGNLEHIKQAVTEGGASAAAAGSLFVYHGPLKGVLINYPEQKVLQNLFVK
ncbi:MAG: imidazole glycerol phosphate synthase subunit HisF [Flavobacteriales bacterium]|nr:imidazole glycerol phosphate synthase subunit HisF [Flavobacteriales bacterium]